MMILISEEINKIICKILKKQHPILAELLLNWGKIVGVKYSCTCSPLKITPSVEKSKKINILHIAADSDSIAVEISYQQELIIERIAIYLGYKAIEKLKVVVM